MHDRTPHATTYVDRFWLASGLDDDAIRASYASFRRHSLLVDESTTRFESMRLDSSALEAMRKQESTSSQSLDKQMTNSSSVPLVLGGQYLRQTSAADAQLPTAAVDGAQQQQSLQQTRSLQQQPLQQQQPSFRAQATVAPGAGIVVIQRMDSGGSSTTPTSRTGDGDGVSGGGGGSSSLSNTLESIAVSVATAQPAMADGAAAGVGTLHPLAPPGP